MDWLKTIAREVFGLFVDDGSFAGAILLWLLIALVVFPRVAAVGHWAGIALFAGLACILVESVLRFAGRRTK